MKTTTLHDVWAAPDNNRLVSKQFSFRLPVHIAAQLAALGEMFPQKNRTQIVADLLTSALEELEKGLPEGVGEPVEDSLCGDIGEQIGQPNQKLYYVGGVRGRFRKLANIHYRELEAELGNTAAWRLFDDIVGTEEDFRK